MRIFLIAALATTAFFSTFFAAGRLSAQESTVDVQAFKPSPFMNDLYNVTLGATEKDKYNWNVGLYINYARNPFVLRNSETDKVVREIVGHQVMGDVLGAIAITKWWDVGLAFPVLIFQKGDGIADQGEPGVAGIGDIRLYLKFRIFETENKVFAIGFAPYFTAPTGKQTDQFAGSAGFTAVPQLAMNLSFKWAGLALNAGYRVVKNESVGDMQLNDELLLRGGGWVWFVPDTFGLIAEASSATTVSEPFAEITQTPLDVVGGFRWFPASWIHLNLGGGLGATQGYSSPDYRILAGFQLTSPPKEEGPKDTDGDGLLDPDDQCPNDPEDKDQFEDEDGCPDPDNDGDGILDPWVEEKDLLEKYADVGEGVDECPEEPEDKDGFEDEDGCPEEEPEPEVEPEPEPEPAPMAKVEGKKIVILEKVYFYYNKTEIMPKSFPVLDDVVQVMNEHPEIEKLRVEGHTDTRGKAKYNKKLSTGRAAEVMRYLIENGVDPERLTSVGYGETQPIVQPEESEDDYEQNRRVEFTILKKSEDADW